jgi:hypothetical protein
VTYGNSRAELQLLEGRGSLKVSEFSRVKMEEDNKGTQIIKMLKGSGNSQAMGLITYDAAAKEKTIKELNCSACRL